MDLRRFVDLWPGSLIVLLHELQLQLIQGPGIGLVMFPGMLLQSDVRAGDILLLANRRGEIWYLRQYLNRLLPDRLMT